MTTVRYMPLRQPDAVHRWVDMVGTNTAHIGDYLAYSGKQVIAVSTADAYYRASGIGIALQQHPQWLNGSAVINSALRVGVNGIYRVSAVTGSYSAGDFAFPVAVGSGQVGQTGATGKAALWSATAVLATGTQGAGQLPLSAVARILRVVAAGATGQWDIELLPFARG
jgi:hypothetical protein